MNDQKPAIEQEWKEERWELLRHFNDMFEKPMIALAFVWLGLLILDFTVGLDPLLQTISDVIWGIFIIDFAIKFIIAPQKIEFLQSNWLTAISLVLPALRIFRIFRAFRVLRAARATRALGLVRLVSSINRGMRAIQNIFGRRGFGMVVVLTIIVLFAGAAGMYAFENPAALAEAGHTEEAESGYGLGSYGESVWWTAMILTTLGSEYWPQTVEGRIVCWLLSIYALAVFSYITATIASYFIDTDRKTGAAGDTAALQTEIRALRAQLKTMIEVSRGDETASP